VFFEIVKDGTGGQQLQKKGEEVYKDRGGGSREKRGRGVSRNGHMKLQIKSLYSSTVNAGCILTAQKVEAMKRRKL